MRIANKYEAMHTQHGWRVLNTETNRYATDTFSSVGPATGATFARHIAKQFKAIQRKQSGNY